ncbi:DUF4123 domain-containing protein [Halomonas aquamarina]|uniref:DUF4123 domain-containing protein n=1 Tax=Vreelandella aquamarina TaxID=77097 RepID=A0ACC5W0G0_9GAMM|nr:DUF4123 domain-containing protein [Halomonas aquamarina]MBZ5489249.1 DUF4123 domain-containing protein [Halomonas aquamarina]
MQRPQAVTHALVDGVRYPDALRRLYSCDDIEDIEPLYLMTRWASLAEQGPILVRLKSSRLADDACANDDSKVYRSLSLLSSQASTSELSRHLGQFVTFNGEGGREQLLRFADPLVTRHWLSSYVSAVPADILGPIDTWWVADWAPNWAEPRPVTWQPFQSHLRQAPPSVSEASTFPPMGRAQLAALEAMARWQLKERLTSYFRKHMPEHWQHLPVENRGRWLDERLDDAAAWGASTERQVAIWLSLSLRWGDGFISARGGLYDRWMMQIGGHQPLSRQEQLYALDVWSRSQETPPESIAQVSRLKNEDTHG